MIGLQCIGRSCPIPAIIEFICLYDGVDIFRSKDTGKPVVPEIIGGPGGRKQNEDCKKHDKASACTLQDPAPISETRLINVLYDFQVPNATDIQENRAFNKIVFVIKSIRLTQEGENRMKPLSVRIGVIKPDEVPAEIRTRLTADGKTVHADGVIYFSAGSKILCCEESKDGEAVVRAMLEGRNAAG